MAYVVVCYSYTGTSRVTAERLARSLKAEIVEIVEERQRPKTVVGRLMTAVGAIFSANPGIKPHTKSFGTGDRVVLCCPIWFGRIAPAARSWLVREGRKPKLLALALHSRTGRLFRAAAEVQALAGRSADATCLFSAADFADGQAERKADGFVRELIALMPNNVVTRGAKGRPS